jgi:CheY-like chemotaxis protein
MMTGKILWVDNDRVFLEPHLLRLQVEGYEVVQAFTLTQGMTELETGRFDMLILDVMMPVKEHEEMRFPPDQTDCGRKSGLVFYRQCKRTGVLNNRGQREVPVLVFTIREDGEIKAEFLRAGLPPDHFMTKSEGADAGLFAAKVGWLLRGGEDDTGDLQ